jgi:hypothetical protein
MIAAKEALAQASNPKTLADLLELELEYLNDKISDAVKKGKTQVVATCGFSSFKALKWKCEKLGYSCEELPSGGEDFMSMRVDWSNPKP